MITIGDAIRAINANAVYEHESTIESIIWRENTNPIELSVIQAKIAELEAAEPLRLLRQQRNQLLAQSDWRATVDYPSSDQTEWLTYRQALRDLPANASPTLDENGMLTNVTWPTEPGA